MCVLAALLCLNLCDSMDYIAHQAPLSMEFSRQKYSSGYPCPSPGDFPELGVEPCFLHCRQIFLPSEPPSKINFFFFNATAPEGSVPEAFYGITVDA